MVEKKRFDGSDAKGATGMLRALRARATASGAVRGEKTSTSSPFSLIRYFWKFQETELFFR